MTWCGYSASVLLTKKFDGGGFYFKDKPDTPVFHYCDCLLYSSGKENEHCVASNSGGRKVLIMFFQALNV